MAQTGATLVRRMRRRVRVVIVALFVLGTAVQVPLIHALSSLIGRLDPWLGRLPLVVALGLTALFLFRRARWRHKSWLPPWYGPTDGPFFAWWFGSIFFVVAALPIWITARCLGGEPARVLGGVLPILALMALAASTLEVLYGAHRLSLRRITVKIAGLPQEFDGYRIVQLSDLHLGEQVPAARVARWVAAARALDADLIALTGDYIASGTAYHEALGEVLAGLRARHGVVATMGNHDYLGNGDDLCRILQERGNPGPAQRRFSRRARRRDDLRGRGRRFLVPPRRSDRRLAARPTGAATILLAHDPDLFDRAAEADVGLVLSGHTHGGQLAVPLLARWANLGWVMSRYTAGSYRRGSSTLYVNRGAGTTALPMRIGVPPEVAEITLRRG